MIVRTESDRGYFLVLDKLYTEQEWLVAAGVLAGSPAAAIAARMYSCFFRGVTDVVAEFENYYKLEFMNLWLFLYWHHMIDDHAIQGVRRAYKGTQHVLYGDVNAGGDYSVAQYAMAPDGGWPAVKRIFEVLRRRQGA